MSDSSSVDLNLDLGGRKFYIAKVSKASSTSSPSSSSSSSTLVTVRSLESSGPIIIPIEKTTLPNNID